MDSSEVKRIVGRFLVDTEIAEGALSGRSAAGVLRIGLGTGTTAIHAIDRIAELCADGAVRDIVCVASSLQSHIRAQQAGLRVSDLNDPAVDGVLDWAFDGADQVNPQFGLVKGGGGAHAREKLVEGCAKRFVVAVDESKLVSKLGGDPAHGGFAVPVEVMPMAIVPVCRAVEAMGASVAPRESKGKIGPVITDNGFVLLDAVFPDGLATGSMLDPVAIEMAIKNLPGVLEVGLFSIPVARVYVGKRDGSVEIRNSGPQR